MAKVCNNCNRGSAKANSRSHSRVATIRRQKINLQPRTIKGKRVQVCTSCLRTEAKKLQTT